MNGWFEAIFVRFFEFPIVLAQGQGKLPFEAYKSSSIDSTYLVWSLAILALTILLIMYATYRYRRWKKFKEFETEMKALDLESEQEGTLAEMVKRYSMDEPVNILFSARLFDEMASVEIKRVLGSPASAKQKQDFIDKVYNIRIKTYHPDWLTSEIQHKKAIELPESIA